MKTRTKIFIITLILVNIFSACKQPERRLTISPTNTQTSTPPTNPYPSNAQIRPPSDLWRAPASVDTLETHIKLAKVVYPLNDPLQLALRLQTIDQRIDHIARHRPWNFKIGDPHKFWAVDQNSGDYFQVDARLAYQTTHVNLFVQEGLDLDIERLGQMCDDFEARIYPVTRAFFGQEWSPGIDGDPHITVLYSDNTGIYQSSTDELPQVINKYSNQMEMFYINAEGDSAYDLCEWAHEFQHIIHWAVDGNEEVWLFEGFSELACPVNGLKAWYSDKIETAFANQPDTQLNAWSVDISQIPAQYGASTIFVSYYLERFGKEATRALIAHPGNGIGGVESALKSFETGLSFDDLFTDWVIANYLDNPALLKGRYGYTSRDLPPFKAQAAYQASQLPVEVRGSVSQYGADYIVLQGPGNFQVDFAGATLVGIAPIQAHNGQFAWWGGRGTNSDTTLTRTFDLKGLDNARLTYFTWYDIDKDRDYAYVEASFDGVTWEIMPGQTTTQTNPYGMNYGAGYNGKSHIWIRETVDLTAYAGEQIFIRFEYLTDDGPVSDGFFLDEIEIPELNYLHDAENDDDGWVADGFLRTNMTLPQTWMIQMIKLVGENTVVERLQLNPDNTGQWSIELKNSESAVLVLSGTTRDTTQAGEYWYRISRN